MNIYIQYLLAILGLFFTIGYAYGQWKNGANQEKIDTITILKSDVETLRNKVEELTNQVKLLRDENAIEKDKFLKAILAIQGDNPMLVEFIKTTNEYMLKTNPVLIRMDKFLDKQTF